MTEARKQELLTAREIKRAAKALKIQRLISMLRSDPTIRMCDAEQRLGMSLGEAAKKLGLTFGKGRR